jgi:hypothetical protein
VWFNADGIMEQWNDGLMGVNAEESLSFKKAIILKIPFRQTQHFNIPAFQLSLTRTDWFHYNRIFSKVISLFHHAPT